MKILCVVDSFFPYGAAISSRIRCFCELYCSLGYDVHVIAQYTQSSDVKSNTVYKIGNYSFQITTLGNPTALSSYIPDFHFRNAIAQYLKQNSCDIVFSLSCSLYFQFIRKITKKLNVQYYIEQCEWQDPSNYMFNIFDIRYLRTDYLRKHGYKKADGIIAISTLLERFYKQQGLKTVRIPTILDVVNTVPNLNSSSNGKKIKIVYSGNPGKSKEYLKPIIECFAYDEKIRSKFQFSIYGPSKDMVIKNIGDTRLLNLASDSIKICGRVSQEQMLDIIKNAHYQVFVRPNRRSSHAGFPTKMGESMMLGTPVIANYTGDISLYLANNINGYVLNDIDARSIIKVLYFIADLSDNEYLLLRNNARRTAEKHFDYHQYLSVVKNMFEG